MKSRAVSSVALVTGRALAVRALGLVGTVALARLLQPSDYGIVALGATFVTFGTVLADGGLAAGFVRGTVEPTRWDLKAALGFQLVLTTLIAVVAGSILVTVGGSTGLAAALMLTTLPIMTFRVPGAVMLERHLNFKPLVAVEIAETVIFNVAAIGLAVAGAGAWGLVAATIARAAAGSAMMMRVAPLGALLPSWDIARLRPMLAFGAQFQGIGVAILGRDQGLNIGTASVGGVALLGQWSFAGRLFQLPLLVLQSLRRVSFPAISRLMALEEIDHKLLVRVLGLTGTVAGGMCVLLAGTAPSAVPVIFGEQWEPIVDLLPLGSLALLINGPIAVCGLSYLLASGDARTPLVSSMIQAAIGVAIALALLDAMGVAALGVSMLAMALVDAVLIGRALHARTGYNPLGKMCRILAAGGVAAGAGWMVSTAGEPSWSRLALSAAVCLGVFGLAQLLVARRDLFDVYFLARRSVGLSSTPGAFDGPSADTGRQQPVPTESERGV